MHAVRNILVLGSVEFEPDVHLCPLPPTLVPDLCIQAAHCVTRKGRSYGPFHPHATSQVLRSVKCSPGIQSCVHTAIVLTPAPWLNLGHHSVPDVHPLTSPVFLQLWSQSLFA